MTVPGNGDRVGASITLQNLVLVAPSNENPCKQGVVLSLPPLLHSDRGKKAGWWANGITSPINPVIGAIMEQMLGNK